MQAELGFALLLAQSAGRIYAAGATRWYKTGEQRGDDQDGNGDGESRYVSGAHSFYQAIQDTARSESRENANSNTDEDHHRLCPSTSRITSRGLAPSVMRTPISGTRWPVK